MTKTYQNGHKVVSYWCLAKEAGREEHRKKNFPGYLKQTKLLLQETANESLFMKGKERLAMLLESLYT